MDYVHSRFTWVVAVGEARTMGLAKDDATSGETPVETAIQQYLNSVEAGNSRKNF